LLEALHLPAGSEVLLSAVTIPDMARIVEHHGLVPVPVDLDARTMAPSVERLRQAITPATRAIVIAHLFGGRIPMEPIHELARQHGLAVIEDCAQAHDGQYRGHPQSDAAMFSFGPIKTATALGGALLCIRDRRLLEPMRRIHASYPVQQRWTFVKRLLKYTALKTLSTRPVYTCLIGTCRMVGYNYDRMVNGAVRGFAGPAFFERIRKQPSVPLLALLGRRLRNYPRKRFERRAVKGQFLASLLSPRLVCPGTALAPHSHWVFAVLADNPEQLMAALSRAGFDATQGQSMRVIGAPPSRPDTQPHVAIDTVARMVFVPMHAGLPDRSIRRMAEVLLRSATPPTDDGAASVRRAREDSSSEIKKPVSHERPRLGVSGDLAARRTHAAN
jgi:dTDP-4-amino-4,6-dideoxygalactose transaminase